MLGALLAAVGGALLALGLLLATVGLYGLLRRRAILHQLHAAGLISGPATLLVLIAAVGTRNAGIMTSAALVALFVVITAPLSGHAIAQAAYRLSGARAEGEPGSPDATPAAEPETSGAAEG